MINILSWIATGISLCGNLLVNRQKIQGFYIWIVSNVLWLAIIASSTANYGQMALYLIYTITSVQGIFNWKKIEKDSKNS